MADKLSTEKRSYLMSQVRSKDTKPEKFIRSLLHKLGYRFRKNVPSLPGKPDIVLPKYRMVIFVHGCFWHQHKGCKRAERPTSNREFWDDKLDKTITRDRKSLELLREIGWKVIVIWECELKDANKIKERIIHELT